MPAARVGGRATGNQYDTVLVIDWMLSRQAPIEQPTSMDEERLRKISLEADLLSLELEKENGKLVPAEEVAQGWARIVIAVRTALLSLPDRFQQMLTLADADRDLIDEEIRGVLEKLADHGSALPGDEEGLNRCR